MVERLGQLEQRNQQLERRVEELSSHRAGVLPLPGDPTAGAQSAVARDARLLAIEQQQQALRREVQALAKPQEAATESADEGPKIEGSVLAVYQGVNAGGSGTAKRQGRINYRGDLSVKLQAGYLGDATGSAYAQLRFGQGAGPGLRPSYTSTSNTTAFEAAAGSAETYAIVAQAWYQLDWPLDSGRFNDQPGSRVSLTLGKMDLFAFFDQNAVAADEGAAFMNNAFVHNPILDSGGDIGADAYGFAPGVRLGYFHAGDTLDWGVSAGAFASGAGADLSASPGRALVIAQLEISPKQINGEARSNYRLYAWTNGRGNDFDGTARKHSGFGASVDQRVGRDWNLFARYGRRTGGEGTFNSALTLGFEHGGRAWGRGGDALGVAVGVLSTGVAWRNATADGTLVGYAATASERVAELYYRIKLSDKLTITPDFQLVQRAGGDRGAPTVRILGLRANLGF